MDREPTWAANVAAGVPEDPADNNVDGIDIAIGVSAETQLLEIKGNQIDLTLNNSVVEGSDVPAIANDAEYADRYFSTFTAGVYYGIFRVDRPPFDDVRLRQAVNLALDRSLLVKIRGGEIATSVWSQILPSNLLADEPLDVYPATPDVEGAKRLIESTGLPTPIKVTMVVQSEGASTPTDALAVKASLDAVGFDIAVKVVPLDVYGGYLSDTTSDLRPRVHELGAGLSGRHDVFRPAADLPRRHPRPGQRRQIL